MSNGTTENEFIDVIEDLGLDDPSIEPWDGEGGNWQPIAAGDYVLSVKDVKKHISKENKPSLNVTFEVAQEGDAFGREIRHNYYSLDKTSKGFGRLVQLIRALGVQTLPGGGLSIESMKGLMCIGEVYIENSTYWSPKKNAQVEGQNNRVKNERTYDPAPKQPAKPAQGQAAKPAGNAQASTQKRAAVGQVSK